MINPADIKNIWVTQRSPTTQLISFSPDRLAIAIPELEATTANQCRLQQKDSLILSTT